MAINVRCPKCKSDLKLSAKKCRCGATIPKKGKTYRVIVRVNGRRTIKAVSNLELAREVEGRLKADAARGEFDIEKKTYPNLQQVWNKYISWAQENKKSWYTDKLNYQNHLQPEFGNTRLDSISPFHIEKLKNSLRRGHCRLDDGIFLSKFPKRLKKEAHIGKEGDQLPDGKLLTQYFSPTEPENQRNRSRAHKLGQRHKGAEQFDLLKISLKVAVTELFVEFLGLFLSAENLQR